MSTAVAFKCPGLSATSRGMLWVNSIGQEFDLGREKILSTGDVALRMRHSTKWVLQRIEACDLYPVIIHNARVIEVYECAIADYYHRHTQKGGASVAA